MKVIYVYTKHFLLPIFKDPVPINGNNYANTLKTNVIMKSDDEEQCIQTFDFDGIYVWMTLKS